MMLPRPEPDRKDYENLRALYGLDSEAGYQWCVICERAFRRGNFRLVAGNRLCPYENCDGGLLFEPWEWSRVRKENPDYPATPHEGVLYPFFGQAPGQGNA